MILTTHVCGSVSSQLEEVQDQFTVSRRREPTKNISRARHVICSEVSKEVRVTSSQLKASFTLANVNVNESIIRRRQGVKQ